MIISKIIADHEKFSKAYFWRPSGNAAARRRAAWSRTVDLNTPLGLIEISQSYHESCRYCYYSSSFFLDGEKKDIRLLKKLI